MTCHSLALFQYSARMRIAGVENRISKFLSVHIMSRTQELLSVFSILLCLPCIRANFKKSNKFNFLAQYSNVAVHTSSPILCAGMCQASPHCEFYYFVRDDHICHMGTMVDFKTIDWSKAMAQPDINSFEIKFHMTRSAPTEGDLIRL